MIRTLTVSCLLCLGFFSPVDAERPVADVALAQNLMLRAWEDAEHRGIFEVERRWPGAFPVARLVAEKGDVDLVVLSGNNSQTLALGPGHLATSALPGERGNTVITGRRDTWFRFLGDLEVDDSIVVETLTGQKHLYRIVGIDVVDARRSSVVLDTPEPMLSLVTGYPFDPDEDGERLRYVVTAKMLF